MLSTISASTDNYIVITGLSNRTYGFCIHPPSDKMATWQKKELVHAKVTSSTQKRFGWACCQAENFLHDITEGKNGGKATWGRKRMIYCTI